MIRSGKLRVALAMAGVLVSVLAVQVTLAGPAQARCNGFGNHITSELKSAGGFLYATETPTETCNGDSVYHGKYKSHVLGWYPSVWIQNNGVWTPHWGYNDNSHRGYSYTDNNSHSYIHLCVSKTKQPGVGEWRCGWGSNVVSGFTHQYYGINNGF